MILICKFLYGLLCLNTDLLHAGILSFKSADLINSLIVPWPMANCLCLQGIMVVVSSSWTDVFVFMKYTTTTLISYKT